MATSHSKRGNLPGSKAGPILVRLSDLDNRVLHTQDSTRIKEAVTNNVGNVNVRYVQPVDSLPTNSLRKTALEMKLKNRPSRVQLIQQGILPPVDSPAKFLKQRIRLQRAQMCDILKHKIEKRPEKKQLISKHILLASGSCDPSLAEKQVQLTRCKLVDSLNDKLAHRPGPLELVQDNILHVDETFQEALKDGRLSFKPTYEGVVQKHPHSLLLLEDDTHSLMNDSTLLLASMDMTGLDTSGMALSAPTTPAPCGGGKASKFKRPKSAASKAVPSASQPYGSVPSPSGKIMKFHEYKGPLPASTLYAHQPVTHTQQSSMCIPVDSSGASVLTCYAPQTPQTTNDSDDTPCPPTQSDAKETSYELLLQQQQLFLQWQLELKQKYPNSVIQLMPISAAAAVVAQQHNPGVINATTPIPMAVPADTSTPSNHLQSMDHALFYKTELDSLDCGLSQEPFTNIQPPTPIPTPVPHPAPTPAPVTKSASGPPVNVTKLEDLRVADLKAECKKRNLPVSGPKPALLERMRPYEDAIVASFHKQPDADSTTCSEESNCQSLKAPPPTICNLIPPPPPPSGSLLLQPSPSASDLRSVSSDTSGVASNYSSPGIDLSSLSFSQAQAGNSLSGMSCFTFASQGSGGQFTLSNQSQTQPAPTQSQPPTQTQPQSTNVMSLPPMMFQPQSSCVSSSNLLLTSSPCAVTAASPSTRSTTPPATMNILSVLSPLLNSSNQGLSPESSTRIDGLTLTAMSATTLSLHEQMLKHQQKKIEELQKELQRSQEQLKHQQQVILAARKAQSERANGTAPVLEGEKSPVEQAAEAWLAEIDTKHLQKFHIQLFLQHKLQQQQLQQQMLMQQELVNTHSKLREELGVQQAVNEVGNLVRSEPRAAMIILQLLKRLQGHDLSNIMQQSVCNSGEPQPPLPQTQHQYSNGSVATTSESSASTVDTKPLASISKKKSKCKTSPASAGLLTPVPPPIPVGCQYPHVPTCAPTTPKKNASRCNSVGAKGSGVDMEEIFRSVLDMASQALQTPDNTNVLGTDTQPLPLPSCDQLLRTSTDEEFSGENMSLEDQSFIYTKNEAFDDLMEVLRDNSDYGAEYPNTFGDMLSTDWMGQSTPSECCGEEASLAINQYVRALHSGDVDELVEDTGEQQMDWLDLILPSPSSTCNPVLTQSCINHGSL